MRVLDFLAGALALVVFRAAAFGFADDVAPLDFALGGFAAAEDFAADDFAADDFAADDLVVADFAADDFAGAVERLRLAVRFLSSPSGKALPTALTAPLATSPTVPATSPTVPATLPAVFPAVRPTCFMILAGSGIGCPPFIRLVVGGRACGVHSPCRSVPRWPFRMALHADKVTPMTHEQPDLPDSIAANVETWTQTNVEYTDGQA
ncbi:MAG TPA: hypothetical protein VJ975_05830, partial [Candidatus Limnocylindria bacterium]|nr:hypothetical protein [Candidatus Limnocylindria bacterium]